jgi:nickel transport protein
MMYAAVRLFPPSRPETEILRGAADRNGSFSFAPDEAGEWRVTVEDGMGHKGAIVVYVDEAGEAAADKAARGGSAGGGGAPLFMRVLLGVSLILNIFAAYAFVLSRVTGRVKGCGQKKEGARAHQ